MIKDMVRKWLGIDKEFLLVSKADAYECALVFAEVLSTAVKKHNDLVDNVDDIQRRLLIIEHLALSKPKTKKK